jgi:uncharacterized membrane protein
LHWQQEEERKYPLEQYWLLNTLFYELQTQNIPFINLLTLAYYNPKNVKKGLSPFLIQSAKRFRG